MSFSPYVFFNGDCAAAFARYAEIFGGESNVMTFADLPDGEDSMPGAEPHHVMHASLKTGDGNGDLLMGSDDPTGDGGAKVGVSVAYTAPDADTGRKIFDLLADGGEVEMPFESTFWSAGFGALRDRWGVPWFIDTAEGA